MNRSIKHIMIWIIVSAAVIFGYGNCGKFETQNEINEGGFEANSVSSYITSMFARVVEKDCTPLSCEGFKFNVVKVTLVKESAGYSRGWFEGKVLRIFSNGQVVGRQTINPSWSENERIVFKTFDTIATNLFNFCGESQEIGFDLYDNKKNSILATSNSVDCPPPRYAGNVFTLGIGGAGSGKGYVTYQIGEKNHPNYNYTNYSGQDYLVGRSNAVQDNEVVIIGARAYLGSVFEGFSDPTCNKVGLITEDKTCIARFELESDSTTVQNPTSAPLGDVLSVTGPTSVAPNSSYTFTGRVRNLATTTNTIRVRGYISGTSNAQVSWKSITFNPQETKNVSFTVTSPSSGSFTPQVQLWTATGSKAFHGNSGDLVTITTSSPTPTETDDAPKPTVSNPTLKAWVFAGTTNGVRDNELQVGVKRLTVFQVYGNGASSSKMNAWRLKITGGQYCNFAKKTGIAPSSTSSTIAKFGVNLTPPGPGGSGSKCQFNIYVDENGSDIKIKSITRIVSP